MSIPEVGTGRAPLSRVLAASVVLLVMAVGVSCGGPGQMVSSETSGGSGITGMILLETSTDPVSGVNVYAYKDHSKNLIGVADYMSRGSGADGAYRLDLPPGEYYIVARKRASGSNYGPVVTGDMYDHRFQENAVRIKAGRYLEQDFVLTLLKEPLFFQVFTEEARKTGTGIRGRILDVDGRPVTGAFATAYMNDDMKRLPDYASTVTDDEGRYILYLPQGGQYYIGARSRARKVPETGEPVGRYKGSEDHSVQVPDGTFAEGIDITLRPFESEVPPGYKPY